MLSKVILSVLAATVAVGLSQAAPDTYPSCPTCPIYSADVWPSLDAAFDSASWIWTTEADFETKVAPAGPSSRGFRRTYRSVKEVTSASILLTVDNLYDLYWNGNLIGSTESGTGTWETAQRYDINCVDPCTNVVAIDGTNILAVPNPAGVIASIQFGYSDGTSEIFVTDSTWRTNASATVPGFQLPGVDDSNWSSARVLGGYGVAPWTTQVVLPS